MVIGGRAALASNLNFLPGQTVPNRVIVPLNPVTKQVSIYNSLGTTDVVVDVDGYYTPLFGTEYYGLVTPTRIADTRPGSGLPYSGQTLGQGTILTVNVPPDTFGPNTGFNAPANFLGVDANLTITDTTARRIHRLPIDGRFFAAIGIGLELGGRPDRGQR